MAGRVLGEGIGPVRVRVTNEKVAIRAKLTLEFKPEQPAFTLKKDDVAAAISLAGSDILEGFFVPWGKEPGLGC